MSHPFLKLGARPVRALCLAASLVLARADVAGAQEADALQSRFAIDDEDPESKVPSPEEAMRTPLQMGYWTMLIAERAELAIERGDRERAVKYYRALAKAVPDRSVSHAKLCTLYEQLGRWEQAADSCRATLGSAGASADDHLHLVRLLLAKQGALTATEVGDADAVIEHLEQALKPGAADPARVQLAQLRCELGLRLSDVTRLRACTETLATIAPKDPRTFAFSWALALATNDFDRASEVVADAKQAGVPAAAIADMESRLQLERDRAPWSVRLRSDARVWLLALGLLLVAAATLFARRHSSRSRPAR